MTRTAPDASAPIDSLMQHVRQRLHALGHADLDGTTPIPVVDLARALPNRPSVEVLYRWLGRGRLAGCKVGRAWFVTLDDVRAFIERGTTARAQRPAMAAAASASSNGREADRAVAAARARIARPARSARQTR